MEPSKHAKLERRRSSKDVFNDSGKSRGIAAPTPFLTFKRLVVIVTCVKLLLINAYRSTDFEVHRNWLAITASMPVAQWYYEATSEWTLDYPPLFAYLEYELGKVARYFDAKMLVVGNLGYASYETVLFQRLSVIVLDAVLIYAVYDAAKFLIQRYPAGALRGQSSPAVLFSCLIIGNVGLIMVDHVHFQYNGLMIGFLILSVTRMMQNEMLMSAVYFSIALNLKHIFLYMAPAYGVFLLRHYCFEDGGGEGEVWGRNVRLIFYPQVRKRKKTANLVGKRNSVRYYHDSNPSRSFASPPSLYR